MSGGNIPYHLRPNKYVERQLFMELLNLVCVRRSPSDYAYISMGGPQLEDHKMIHHHLRFRTLISLETKDAVHKRQIFNKRISLVHCKLQSTGDFLREFNTYHDLLEDKTLVVWFDYATASQRGDQISEFATLFEKLEPFDVAKITINADAKTLGNTEVAEGEGEGDVMSRRLQRLRGQLNRHTSTTTRDVKGGMNSKIG